MDAVVSIPCHHLICVVGGQGYQTSELTCKDLKHKVCHHSVEIELDYGMGAFN
jgi:hypothetical protein